MQSLKDSVDEINNERTTSHPPGRQENVQIGRPQRPPVQPYQPMPSQEYYYDPSYHHEYYYQPPMPLPNHGDQQLYVQTQAARSEIQKPQRSPNPIDGNPHHHDRFAHKPPYPYDMQHGVRRDFDNVSLQSGQSNYGEPQYRQMPNRPYDPNRYRNSDTASNHSNQSHQIREVFNQHQRQEQKPAAGSVPIPHENLEAYRQEVMKSNDPEKQFAFGKQLILVAEEMRKNKLKLDPAKVKKNREILHSEALKWIKKAAAAPYRGKTGYPEALFFLADSYGNGNLGLTIDHDRAFSYYIQGAKHDHSGCIYRTGVCYEVGAGPKKDHSRAVQYYKKAAILGDTAAMYKIGIILLTGTLGVARNPREGVTFLKRAASQADETTPFALHELAALYENPHVDPSIGIVPDPPHAYELYLKSAKLGYAPSQYKLGLSFEYGHMGLPKDAARSIGWYTRAAEQGDPDAELALSGWYLTGADHILERNDEEAYLWARKAADKGLSKAEYAVAYFLEHGVGVKSDLSEARRWYVRAASQGNERAIARLKGNQAQAYPKPSQWRHDQAARDGNCSVM